MRASKAGHNQVRKRRGPRYLSGQNVEHTKGHLEVAQEGSTTRPPAIQQPKASGPPKPRDFKGKEARRTMDYPFIWHTPNSKASSEDISSGGNSLSTRPRAIPRSQASHPQAPRSRWQTVRDLSGNPIPRDPSGQDAYGLERPRDTSEQCESRLAERRKLQTQVPVVQSSKYGNPTLQDPNGNDTYDWKDLEMSEMDMKRDVQSD